ncbi:unnamed protein product [Mytilus coruscus]|uniref:Ankyrin repeat domain-containing protein 54 n=1 Tax=Mytilus coruscus TaxID=42192 RepID=A0A6J7ZXF0_MYTCO|nr:unnamed protein product [Mytilus coruscus]
MFDMLVGTVGRHFIPCILKHSNSEFIKDYIELLQFTTDRNPNTIKIESKYEKLYFRRIIDDINNGLNWDVFETVQMERKEYRLFFLENVLKTENPTFCRSKKDGSTPLHVTSLLGYNDLSFFFVESDKSQVNSRDNTGKTPLHLACSKGNAAVAKILIKFNAEVNQMDTNKITPFMLACSSDTCINKPNGKGYTPFYLAISSGQHEIAKTIIKYGADPNYQNDDGLTPLHIACETNKFEIVKTLLEQYQVEFNKEDNKGRTPLDVSKIHNRKDISEYLIEREPINENILARKCKYAQHNLEDQKEYRLKKTVLIALRYLGHSGNIRLISDIFNVSDSTVITCRDRVISALASIKDEYICWPLDAASQANVSQKFEEKKGFPGVIGAIDGTHIQINAPKEHGQSYVNRKNYHSKILQSVCLPNMKFSHIYSGWPGSVHDSRVLKNSELWENGEVACQSNHIIGDGAYPIKKWLLTPYRDTGNLNAEQRRFNYVHSSTRSVIERAFGILKGRFKKLQFIEVKKIQTACDVITACCVLQNFCIMFWDTGEDFIDEAENQELNACNNQPLNDVDGISKRDRIARSLM